MWYSILFVIFCVVFVAALFGLIYSQIKDDLPDKWTEDDIP